MAKLVIVESPAKAKTIGKYLGDDYEVTASMGHIRDLPASQLGIDVEHDYAPQYISIKGKEKLIKELKSKAKHADGVLLATDPDREGEAISWHLANILGLDPHEPNRVTFDEITKKGVKEGMAHPRAIDEDLFNAQQARRVLDRLVGYKLSPFLWRKVRRGLSAGRVQSVAVRLIDDREKEIENFKPDEYWNVDATLGAGHKSFTARLASDSKGKKLLPKNEAEARAIEKGLEGAEYVVTELKKGKRAKQPTPAFITSTLQQEASRRLGFTATRTMRAAQTLYEGVDIAGHGTMGLITYMRTDSLRISDEAVAAAYQPLVDAQRGFYLQSLLDQCRVAVEPGRQPLYLSPGVAFATPHVVVDNLRPDDNIHHSHRGVYAAGHAGVEHAVGVVAVDELVGPNGRRYLADAALGEYQLVGTVRAYGKERSAVALFAGIFQQATHAIELALHGYDNSYFHLLVFSFEQR